MALSELFILSKFLWAKSNLYEYAAHVRSAYDGDTVRVDIDCGFGIILQNQVVRLLGINTPEIRGEDRAAGLKSRDALRDKILGKEVLLKTFKDKKGKYGRWLGVIYIEGEPTSVNDWLLAEGLAVRYGK